LRLQLTLLLLLSWLFVLLDNPVILLILVGAVIKDLL
jgi:hypothetical protein